MQAQSSNLKLLHAIARAAPKEVEVEIYDALRELPHFSPDIDTEPAQPAVQAWREALASADAVLIASPEYAYSLPGSLKNGIDWLVGSGELYRKVVAITAAVRDPQRGRRGLQALEDTLVAVDVSLVWRRPIVLDAADRDDKIARLLKALLAPVTQ